MTALRIDIFSDVICPWCFLGKHQLELAMKEHADTVFEVHWRPFMLNPDTPPEGVSRAEYFRKRFGANPSALDVAHARLAELGAKVGIRFAFDRAERIPNTIAAHAVIRWASERKLEDVVVERLFAAYFTEGRDLGDHETLADIAAEGGLDRQEVIERLEREADFEAVRADADSARRTGIEGVPFYVFGERLAVSGAQPPDVLSKVIERAVAPGPG